MASLAAAATNAVRARKRATATVSAGNWRSCRAPPDRAIVLITHYQRLLDYVEPDRIHVLQGGRIVQSGDKSLALELERRGYGVVEDAA